MRRIITIFLASMGFFFLLGLSGLIALIFYFQPTAEVKKLPEHFVLTIDMAKQQSREFNTGLQLSSAFTPHTLTFYDLTQVLTAAIKDPRVHSIFLKIDGCPLSLAQIQEIRSLIAQFRATKRKIVAFAYEYGGGGNGTVAYYLARACNEVVMQPMGNLNLTGFMMEVPFAKKALSDFDIKPQIAKREAYKSMPETALESDFTPAHRENMTTLLDGLMEQITTDMAKDLKIEPATMRTYIDNGPYIPKEALDKKLIDRTAYFFSFLEECKENHMLVSAYTYLQQITQTSHQKNSIALVFAEGSISSGGDDDSFGGDGTGIHGEATAEIIYDLVKDDRVKAIVFRINSGGGSPSASETIADAMRQAKAKGKPVIISMSSAAASGGYWIATQGTKIVAQPATLTGSIGVFGGKVVTQGAWEKYGVHWGEVHSGKNAGMWSSSQVYSPDEWTKLNEEMDYIYEEFLKNVSETRGLSIPKVRDVAQGRVWLGSEARKNGLVDELGGIKEAIALAIKEAKLDKESPEHISIDEYPRRKTFFQALYSLSADAEIKMAMKTLLHSYGAPFSSLLMPKKKHLLEMPDMPIQ